MIKMNKCISRGILRNEYSSVMWWTIIGSVSLVPPYEMQLLYLNSICSYDYLTIFVSFNFLNHWSLATPKKILLLMLDSAQFIFFSMLKKLFFLLHIYSAWQIILSGQNVLYFFLSVPCGWLWVHQLPDRFCS